MHGRRGSNSRHLVLETSALPTELLPYATAKIRQLFELANVSTKNITNKTNFPEKIGTLTKTHTCVGILTYVRW